MPDAIQPERAASTGKFAVWLERIDGSDARLDEFVSLVNAKDAALKQSRADADESLWRVIVYDSAGVVAYSLDSK